MIAKRPFGRSTSSALGGDFRATSPAGGVAATLLVNSGSAFTRLLVIWQRTDYGATREYE
jgi:hypothetical protein